MNDTTRTRDEALALVDAVLASGYRSVWAYCRALGENPSTVMCRFHRAGHNLGGMLRAEKLRRIRERPAGMSLERAATELGNYAAGSSYYRARRAAQLQEVSRG